MVNVYLGTQPFGPSAPQDPQTLARVTKVYLGTWPEKTGAQTTPTANRRGLEASAGTKVNLGAPTGPAQAVDLKNMTTPPPRPLRILFSYHYYKDEDIDRCVNETLKGTNCDVFADSGAFSAWTTGSPITVKEYADWLARWGKNFTCAAALDVIGDAEASFKQTEELRKLVDPSLPVLPVFHSNDEGGFKWLQKYIDAGYKYIGISPTGAIYGNHKLMQAWLTKCFQMMPEDVGYHGFGVTGWRTLKAFPWYSVDSSSWTSSFRYAQLSLFDVKRGDWGKMQMRSAKEILQNTKLLADYGLRPSDVRADGYARDKLCGALVLSWQRAEEWLEKWHSKNQRVYLGTVTGEKTPNSPDTLGRAMQLKGTP